MEGRNGFLLIRGLDWSARKRGVGDTKVECSVEAKRGLKKERKKQAPNEEQL
jgi:hypothetical protein